MIATLFIAEVMIGSGFWHFVFFFHTTVSAPLIIAKGKLRYIDLCNKFSSNNIELKRYGPHPDLKRQG